MSGTELHECTVSAFGSQLWFLMPEFAWILIAAVLFLITHVLPVILIFPVPIMNAALSKLSK